MTSDVLYGNLVYKPYFNMQKFENSIYNRASIREKRIKTRKKLRVLDKMLAIIIVIAAVGLLAMSVAVIYRSAMIKDRNNYIKKLETTLEMKKYEKNNVVSSLKSEMKFDDIKMKAYMELNMITPTEKNIIRFDKSDNGFVRQYENIR